MLSCRAEVLAEAEGEGEVAEITSVRAGAKTGAGLDSEDEEEGG
jgi:hypothetical protein